MDAVATKPFLYCNLRLRVSVFRPSQSTGLGLALSVNCKNLETKRLGRGGSEQFDGVGVRRHSSVSASASASVASTVGPNPTLVAGLLALVIAQWMKVVLNLAVERKWEFRILWASGGMPSSHSALCTALSTSVALCHGLSDPLFPVCLGFTLIVMFDATGVRRHAGIQAQVLNKIVEDLFQGHPISQRKLKELLGHTPSQVFAGAVLGILVAYICCRSLLV